MKKIYYFGLSIILASLVYGCKEKEPEEMDTSHEEQVEGISYEDVKDGQGTNSLPEGNFSTTYYMYGIEESLGDNGEINVCFSYGELSQTEYNEKSKTSDKELAYKTCLPFTEDNPNLKIDGGTGVENARVRVTSEEGKEPVYEITM